MALMVTMEVAADPAALTCALEGLVRQNEHLMGEAELGGGGYPSLYESGVRYRREPQGQEDWKTADRVFADGFADCEDLSAVRAAELRRDGEPATAIVIPTKKRKFHAVVLRANGDLEDPSRLLAARENNMGKKTKICIRDVGDHCVASICLPTRNGKTLDAHEVGFDPWSALTKVIGAVLKVASNPAVASLLPPQAAIAIQVAARIADMSPEALRKLIEDDRSTDAQRKLAGKVLVAKQEGAGAQLAELGFGITDIAKAVTTAFVPAAGLTWIAADAASKGIRDAQKRPPRVIQGPGRAARPDRMPATQMPPQAPPGYPGYPPQGYPPGYPSPYPPQYPPGYGAAYPPYPYYPGSPPQQQQGYYFDPSEMAAFMQQQQAPAAMMTPEEAAAIMMWGAGAFAPGSFPGFDEGGQGQEQWAY